MGENTIINLADVMENNEVEIAVIKAGRNAAQRLNEMGLVPGTKVTVIRKGPMRGPVELIVRNSHLVIGHGLVSKIYVKM
ncbi:MAG: FeoA family protein [Thermoanaerobacteraceae bacterium]